MRITLYALDYSVWLHGNTNLTFQTGIHSSSYPPDAWALRCTPYATTHTSTWGAIVSELAKTNPRAAASLLASLAELPGARKLGSSSSHVQLHPEVQRPGRGPPAQCQLSEGTWAALRDVHSHVVLDTGHVTHFGKGFVYVGKTLFVPGEHVAEAVTLPEKRKRGGK